MRSEEQVSGMLCPVCRTGLALSGCGGNLAKLYGSKECRDRRASRLEKCLGTSISPSLSGGFRHILHQRLPIRYRPKNGILTV